MQMKCFGVQRLNDTNTTLVWPSPLMLNVNSWQISCCISARVLSSNAHHWSLSQCGRDVKLLGCLKPEVIAVESVAAHCSTFVSSLNFKTNCFCKRPWADTLVNGCQFALQINSCDSGGKAAEGRDSIGNSFSSSAFVYTPKDANAWALSLSPNRNYTLLACAFKW